MHKTLVLVLLLFGVVSAAALKTDTLKNVVGTAVGLFDNQVWFRDHGDSAWVSLDSIKGFSDSARVAGFAHDVDSAKAGLILGNGLSGDKSLTFDATTDATLTWNGTRLTSSDTFAAPYFIGGIVGLSDTMDARINGTEEYLARFDATGHGLTSSLIQDNGSRVSMYTDDPKGLFDLCYGGLALVFGGDLAATTRTDNTTKAARVAAVQYDNDANGTAVFVISNDSIDNKLYFGGGSTFLNAASFIGFYTGSGTTTSPGTRWMSLDSLGMFRLAGLTASRMVSANSNRELVSIDAYPSDDTMVVDYSLLRTIGETQQYQIFNSKFSYDYRNGTLVTTNIPLTVSTMMVLEVVGMCYISSTTNQDTIPNITTIQTRYAAGDKFYSSSGLSTANLDTIYAFERGGVVCFWHNKGPANYYSYQYTLKTASGVTVPKLVLTNEACPVDTTDPVAIVCKHMINSRDMAAVIDGATPYLARYKSDHALDSTGIYYDSLTGDVTLPYRLFFSVYNASAGIVKWGSGTGTYFSTGSYPNADSGAFIVLNGNTHVEPGLLQLSSGNAGNIELYSSLLYDVHAQQHDYYMSDDTLAQLKLTYSPATGITFRGFMDHDTGSNYNLNFVSGPDASESVHGFHVAPEYIRFRDTVYFDKGFIGGAGTFSFYHGVEPTFYALAETDSTFTTGKISESPDSTLHVYAPGSAFPTDMVRIKNDDSIYLGKYLSTPSADTFVQEVGGYLYKKTWPLYRSTASDSLIVFPANQRRYRFLNGTMEWCEYATPMLTIDDHSLHVKDSTAPDNGLAIYTRVEGQGASDSLMYKLFHDSLVVTPQAYFKRAIHGKSDSSVIADSTKKVPYNYDYGTHDNEWYGSWGSNDATAGSLNKWIKVMTVRLSGNYAGVYMSADIYPRIGDPTGMPYTLSTTVRHDNIPNWYYSRIEFSRKTATSGPVVFSDAVWVQRSAVNPDTLDLWLKCGYYCTSVPVTAHYQLSGATVLYMLNGAGDTATAYTPGSDTGFVNDSSYALYVAGTKLPLHGKADSSVIADSTKKNVAHDHDTRYHTKAEMIDGIRDFHFDSLSLNSLVENTAIYSNGVKHITSLSTVSATELGYLDGVNNPIQEQFTQKRCVSVAPYCSLFDASTYRARVQANLTINYNDSTVTFSIPAITGTVSGGSVFLHTTTFPTDYNLDLTSNPTVHAACAAINGDPGVAWVQQASATTFSVSTVGLDDFASGTLLIYSFVLHYKFSSY